MFLDAIKKGLPVVAGCKCHQGYTGTVKAVLPSGYVEVTLDTDGDTICLIPEHVTKQET